MSRKAGVTSGATVCVDGRWLGKRFGHLWALRAINVSISVGETIALVGPNGAGKTTLLRLLATISRPTEGALRLFGELVEEENHSIRRRIGYAGHTSLLYPQLTVKENLGFYARLYRIAAPAERVEELTNRLGLVGWAQRPVHSLSRGLEQRAALARALLHEPDLLLLDEALTGLDTEAIDRVLRLLAELRQKGLTIVFSTHDFAQAQALGQRVLCLNGGQVIYDGPMVRPLAKAYRTWIKSALPFKV